MNPETTVTMHLGSSGDITKSHKFWPQIIISLSKHPPSSLRTAKLIYFPKS